MLKPFIRPLFLLAVLVLIPFLAFCQLPVPTWVDQMGGPGDSKPTGMVVDHQNNIYVTGYYEGTVDFDPSAGVHNLTSSGGYDCYIAKYSPAGALIWAYSVGGDGLDQANYMGIDANGNVTVIGQTESSSFTSGPTGGHVLTGQGGDDIFIVGLNTNGQYIWSGLYGGGGTERGEEVNADHQGNFIATSIVSSNLTIDGNNINTTGFFNGLVTKFDATGHLLWYINLQGSGDTEVFGDGIDSQNNIIVSGVFSGDVDFNPRGAPHHIISANGKYPFVAKYDSNGQLIWVKTFGGTLIADQSFVNIDSGDNINVSGGFDPSLIFDGGTTTLNGIGQSDVFIAKYAPDGTFKWARSMPSGANTRAFPYQMQTDQDNNIYVAGYISDGTGTVDFNPDPNQTNTVANHGQRDFFLGKYDQNGNYKWAFSGGSANCSNTFGIELAINSNRDLILGGAFCSTVDFDPSACRVKNLTAINGTSDTFIADYSQYAATSFDSKITAFTIPNQVGSSVIDDAHATITVTMPAGTSVTALKPTITTSNSGTLNPLSGVAKDFSQPVQYKLSTSCDNVIYTVTVVFDTPPVVTPLTACPASLNTLSGSTPAVTGETFLWQMQANGVWQQADPANNQPNYVLTTPENQTAVNQVWHYRRQVTNQGNITYDSYYDVTVKPSSMGNTITANNPVICVGDQTLIAGSTPEVFVVTGADFTWEQSTDGTTWMPIVGINSRDFALTATSITPLTYYRRITNVNGCTKYSNVVSITVNAPVTTAVAGPAQDVCQQAQMTLTANTPASGETGIWTVMAPVGYNPFTAASVHDPHAIINNFPQDQTVQLRWTVTKQGCVAPSTSDVTLFSHSAPLITRFTISGQTSAAIDQNAKTITIVMPANTNLTALRPTITKSASAISVSPASGAATNFTQPVTYTVNGNAACAAVTYTVIVTSASAPSTLEICSKATTMLSGATVIGATYQWQELQGAAWANAAGFSNTNNYITQAVVNTTGAKIVNSYRRMVTVGQGVPTYDSFFDVTVDPGTAGNTISADYTQACQPAPQVTFTGNQPDGYTSSSVYSWQKSVDNTNWADIPNQNGINLTFTGTIADNTYFRRLTTTGTCSADYSNVVLISGYSTIGGTVDVPPDICQQTQVTLAASTSDANQTGTWSVISPAGYNPFTAANMHDPHAVITNVPQDQLIKLQWAVAGPGCSTVVPIVVSFTSHSQAAITGFSIPGQMGANIDQNAKTITVAMPPNTNLSSLTPTVSKSGSAISVSPASGTAQNFNQPVTYTVTGSAACGPVTYTVNVTATGATPLEACSGITVSLAGTVVSGAVYRWQVLQGNTWVDAPVPNSAPGYLTPANVNTTGAKIIKSYRRMITVGQANPDYDSYYDETVDPSTAGNIINADKTQFCANDNTPANITGNQPTGYYNGVTYQWEQSSDGVIWQSIAGQTGQNYSGGFLPGAGSFYIRRESLAAQCTDYSNIINFTVNNTLPSITAFTIPGKSGATNIDQANKTISITVPPHTDVTALTTAITTGNTTDVLSPASGTPQNFTSPVVYTVTGTCAVVPYTVTVNVAPATPIEICSGNSNGILIGTGGAPAGSVYKWQVLQGTTWASAASGNTGADYPVPTPVNTTGVKTVSSYRRMITDAQGNISFDSYYDLTIDPSTTGNVITANKTMFCGSDVTPANITGPVPTGFVAGDTYRWEQSPDNVNWQPLAGQNGKDYLGVQPVADNFYVRRVTVSPGCEAPSNSINFTINHSQAAITGFSLPGQSGVTIIDQVAKTITVTMSPHTDLSALVPAVTVDKPADVLLPASGTAQNFNSPVIYKVSDACSITPYTVKVAISTATPKETCSGVGILLTGSTAAVSGDVYKWQVFQNNGWVDASIQSTLADFTTPGQTNTTGANVVYSYRRMITDAQGNTTYDSFYDVTVDPGTTGNAITPATTQVCAGRSATILFTGNTPTGYFSGVTYSWEQSADNINWQPIAAAIGQSYQYSGTPTASFYVRRATMAGSCTPQYSNPAYVNYNSTAPTITGFTIAGQVGATTIEDGPKIITITMLPHTDVTSLVPAIVTNDPLNTLSPASGTAQNFSSPVQYTVSNSCQLATYSVTVTLQTALPLEICSDNTAQLIGQAANNMSNFNWQMLQNGNWVNAAGSNNGPDYQTIKFANYTGVKAAYSFRRQVFLPGGSTSYDSYYDLTVDPSTINNVISVDNTQVCAGANTPVTFTGNVPTGYYSGVTYSWEQSIDNGATWQPISGATGQSYPYNSPITQTIMVHRITMAGACGKPSNDITVTYNAPVTTAVAGQAQNLCGQSRTTLAGNAPGFNETGTWSVVSPANYNPFNTASVHNPTATINNIPPDVDVQLKWTVTNSYCAQSSNGTVTIRNNSLPTVTAGNKVYINLGEKATLGANVQGAGGTILWSPATGLDNPTSANPVASPTETTEYTVTVTSAAGCSVFATQTVVVTTDISIPNTFTPNADGINDTWNIKNIQYYPNTDVWIFTRWGQQVFYSHGYPVPWDGTLGGKKLATGVYYYIIKLNDLKVSKSGSLTLLY